jgi:F-type H+-transporting ATPase subunit b
MGRWAAILFAACLVLGNIAAAQDSTSQDQAKQNAEQRNAAAEQSSAGDGNTGVGTILATTTEQAAHTADKWGKKLGLGPDVSFLISIFLNFLGVFLIFFFLLKSKLPQAFRERTAAIQRGIKDAEAASADAASRLSGIESRLAKLDGEVAEIRAAAERDVAAEEQRIKQAAEEDKQKVIAAAQTEIAAIARSARRELKGYAASLAVDLAAREIQVDDKTDQALVHEFVDRLGKDGR